MGNLTPHEKLFEMGLMMGFPNKIENYFVSYDFDAYDAEIICECGIVEKIKIMRRLVDE